MSIFNKLNYLTDVYKMNKSRLNSAKCFYVAITAVLLPTLT